MNQQEIGDLKEIEIVLFISLPPALPRHHRLAVSLYWRSSYLAPFLKQLSSLPSLISGPSVKPFSLRDIMHPGVTSPMVVYYPLLVSLNPAYIFENSHVFKCPHLNLPFISFWDPDW